MATSYLVARKYKSFIGINQKEFPDALCRGFRFTFPLEPSELPFGNSG